MNVEEGTISVDGYRVWYRRVGRGGIPLLVLHGGPGPGHDHLEPLEALASDRAVVFYEFYKRHLCRLDPWPEPLLRSVRNLEGNAVYETMNGPNEFMVIGNLKDWDRIDRLGEITAPTPITVGRYDEIPPTCAETMHRRIPNSQMRVFDQSSHTAHLEETDKYLQAVADFSGTPRLRHCTRYAAPRPTAGRLLAAEERSMNDLFFFPH